MENSFNSELLSFYEPLEGRLLSRYKRFFSDFELADGSKVIAHCTNTGSMRSVYVPGQRAILSKSQNPDRKLKYTWEAIQLGSDSHWVGINTANPNRLVHEGLKKGIFKEISSVNSVIEPEKKINKETRIDFCLTDEKGKKTYIEVKNVTLLENKETVAYFPDSVSVRAKKHLETLASLAAEGHQAIVLYVVQRTDALSVGPALHIDPDYSKTFDTMQTKKVETLAYSFKVSPTGISFHKKIPVLNSQGHKL